MNPNTGLSTSWQSSVIRDGDALLHKLKESGLDRLEVDYRIHNDELEKIKKRLRSEFEVLSVHNPCPIPADHAKRNKPWRMAEFSAIDEDERRYAVKRGIETLQLAADLEALAVVFHFGFVDMDSDKKTLHSFFHDGKIGSPEHQKFIEKKLTERQRRAPVYFEEVLRSVDALNREAEKVGVWIGAENRLHFNEIPFKDEFARLFAEFDGGRVGYWHDVGHGEVQQRLGILDAEKDLLHPYRRLIIGMHLHDVDGLHDHVAPGNGSVDFSTLKHALKHDSLRIFEVHDDQFAADIKSGIQKLADLHLI